MRHEVSFMVARETTNSSVHPTVPLLFLWLITAGGTLGKDGQAREVFFSAAVVFFSCGGKTLSKLLARGWMCCSFL